MGIIESVTYETEDLNAGRVVSAVKTAVADTYHKGMLLGMVTATNKYGAWDATGTYDVLNETDIPNGATIVVNATVAATPGTAVLSGDILYVNSTTDQGTAETARDAVAGLEQIVAVYPGPTRTLGADGRISTWINGSEVQQDGLVDSSNVTLTVTAAIIENAQRNGIIIKEQ